MAKEEKEKNLRMIAGINSVEGFNPEAEAIKVEQSVPGEDSEYTSFIPVQKKKAWFRLAMPTGRITAAMTYPMLNPGMSWDEQKALGMSCSQVVFTAEVYASINDSFPLADGIGTAFRNELDDRTDPSEVFPRLMQLARGRAESRALYNAGFGLQFYGKDEVSIVEQIAKDQKIVKVSTLTTSQVQTDKTDKESPLPPSPTQGMDSISAPAMGFIPTVSPAQVAPQGFALGQPQKLPRTHAEPSESSFRVEGMHGASKALEDDTKPRRKRRTQQELYDDACDRLEELADKIVAAQKKVLAATGEVSKASAESYLSDLKNEFEETKSDILQRLEKSKAIRPRSGIRDDYDAILESVSLEDERWEEAEALAEMYSEAEEEDGYTAFLEWDELSPNPKQPLEPATPATVSLDDAVCSFAGYKGKKYKDIAAAPEGGDILIWLMKSESIDQSEKDVIVQFIKKDENLAARAARQGVI